MVPQAYVLIKTHVDRTPDVFQALQSIEALRRADIIMGPYDIIALMEAEDASKIGDSILDIREINGVLDTLSCLIVRTTTSP